MGSDKTFLVFLLDKLLIIFLIYLQNELKKNEMFYFFFLYLFSEHDKRERERSKSN